MLDWFLLTSFILSLGALSPSCSSKMNSDLIQMGIVPLNFLFQQQTTTTSIAISFAIPPSGFSSTAALANFISSTEAKRQDFLLTTRQNVTKLLITLSTSSPWTAIKVSYVATARNDIYLGSFVFGTMFSYVGTNLEYAGPVFQAITQRKQIFDGKDQANSIAFIAGFKSATIIPFFNVTSNVKEGLLTVTVVVNATSIIQSIKIAYIVYTTKLDLTATLENGISFTGERLFQYSAVISNGLILPSTFTLTKDRLNCLGPTSICKSQCVSKAQCKTMSGSISNTNCLVCPQGLTWSGSLSKCACNRTSIQKDKICTPCPQNTLPNSQATACVCIYGFVLDPTNDKCLPVSTVVDCSFLPGSHPDSSSGECVCTDPLSAVTPSGCQCVQDAHLQGLSQINSIGLTTEQRCQCDSQFIIHQHTCVKCDVNYIPNPTQSLCICPQGYYITESKACTKKCPLPNMVIHSAVCICDFSRGYYNVSNNCQQNGCLQRTTMDAMLKCVCDDPLMKLTPSGCMCHEGLMFVEGKCLCLDGITPKSGQCVTSPNTLAMTDLQNHLTSFGDNSPSGGDVVEAPPK